jgi:hypothetical protein
MPARHDRFGVYDDHGQIGVFGGADNYLGIVVHKHEAGRFDRFEFGYVRRPAGVFVVNKIFLWISIKLLQRRL